LAAVNNPAVAFTAAKLATVPLNPARGCAPDANEVAAPPKLGFQRSHPRWEHG
jgi:hypothetical protein